jgi:hypothetical protein
MLTRMSGGIARRQAEIPVCANALLDAPDLARHWDACRTDTAPGKSCFARLYSLAATVCDSALRDCSDRNAGSHHR